MAEYIEKAELMSLIESEARIWGDDYDYLQILGDIEDFPPADVRPVRRGRWIVHYDDIWPTESTQECSECHEEVPLLIDCKFCPNCTAEMEVDEDG